MKTKTLIILFALVMALSVSAGVFAQDAWSETWDEDTVLQVFGGVDLIFPDMFADEDSDFIWVSEDPFADAAFPSSFSNKTVAKAPIETAVVKGNFTFDPCGDGLIKFTVTLNRKDFDGNPANQSDLTKYGPETETYIRNITATLGEDKIPLTVKKCNTKGSDSCNVVKFNKKGEAEITGYLYYPGVLLGATAADNGYTSNVGDTVKMTIEFSNYFTALWDITSKTKTVDAEGTLAEGKDYCQYTINETDMAGVYAIRAKYDQHTGEARFQAVLRNFAQEAVSPSNGGGFVSKQNYVIPADVLVPFLMEVEKAEAEEGGSETPGGDTPSGDTPSGDTPGGDTPSGETPSGDGTGGAADDDTTESSTEKVLAFERYTNYTCKYTVYNNGNAAPRTDYCEFGEGIALAKNAIIRFDITINTLSSDMLLAYPEKKIPFMFRVGGLPYLVGSFNGVETVKYDIDKYDSYLKQADMEDPMGELLDLDYIAAFDKTAYPCPIVSRMQVMDPLKPFTSFFLMDSDDPIEASGAYGVYEGGLWGMYQKCGKYAYMAVRLKNGGIRDENVNLDKVAVAINGGTPMSWNWVLSSHELEEDNLIVLKPGEHVVLIGRAKVTDYTYQMNSDQAITGAVNFLDYGFYIQGKVYSDHNNTNCTVAP